MDTIVQSAASGAPVTFALIAINVIVFIVETVSGGSMNIDVARRFGAMTVGDLERGQWWRLLSSMFVHFGIVHLGCNMLSLLNLGVVIERYLGSSLMSGSVFTAVVYLVSGLAGNLLTWRVQRSRGQYYVVYAGASGAICGLLGVYVAMLLVPGLSSMLDFKAVLFNVALCIAPGLSNKEVNLWAHLGGLVGGFLVAVVYFFLLRA